MAFGFKESFTASLELNEYGSGTINVPTDINDKFRKMKRTRTGGVFSKFTLEFIALEKVIESHLGSEHSVQVKEYTHTDSQRDYGATLLYPHFYKLNVSHHESDKTCFNFGLVHPMYLSLSNQKSRKKFREACMWELRDLFPMEIKVTIEVYDSFKLCQLMYSQMSGIEQLQKKLEDIETKLSLTQCTSTDNLIEELEESTSETSTPTPQDPKEVTSQEVTNKDIMEQLREIKMLLKSTLDEPSW